MTRGARGHRAGGSEDPPLQPTGVERAEVGMGRGFSLESGGKTAALQSAAVAAVGKGERTQRGTVLGAIGGHGSLQKERLDLGFLGDPRGGEAHFRTKTLYRAVLAMSIEFQ